MLRIGVTMLRIGVTMLRIGVDQECRECAYLTFLRNTPEESDNDRTLGVLPGFSQFYTRVLASFTPFGQKVDLLLASFTPFGQKIGYLRRFTGFMGGL